MKIRLPALIIMGLMAVCLVSCLKKGGYELVSPDGTVSVVLTKDPAGWAYTVFLNDEKGKTEIVETSRLGLKRSDGDFYVDLHLTGISEKRIIDETYTMPTGKRRQNRNHAREFTLSFENLSGDPLDIVFRAYDTGIAFRYVFPDSGDEQHSVEEEFTSFNLPQPGNAWLQPYDTLGIWNPAYEKGYERGLKIGDSSPMSTGWGFPGLFEVKDAWILISEAGVYENFCGSHFHQNSLNGIYSTAFPWAWENYGMGEVEPVSSLPWQMPWRVILVSRDLGDIVESNIIHHLAEPSKLEDDSWIEPGRSSWSWWGDHESPFYYDKLKAYVDLAAEMGWEYSLVDAGWHEMKGGDIRKLIDYANSRDVGIFLWYNSGGPHTRVMEAGPRDRMYDPEIRRSEFKKISEWGVKGVKVDFFQSDKQDIMKLYLEIATDAAEYNLLLNTHGSTIPRGWSRTYPNFLTMEGVMGAEAYTYVNTGEFPWFNNVYPYTRNVIGPMDYTPLTFTDYRESQKRMTTHAHELALVVVFESGIQHLASRIEGIHSTPGYVREYVKMVPVAWDDTRFIDGYPGKFTVLAREKGNELYFAGIFNNAEEKIYTLDLSFLPEGAWNGRLISDGAGQKSFKLQEVDSGDSDTIAIRVLPHGGFAGKFVKQ